MRLAISFILLAVGWWPPAAIAEPDTPLWGGSGTEGSGFSVPCGSDSLMVGLAGHAGTLVDQVQPVCAKVYVDGVRAGGTSQRMAVGGPGGNAFGLACPAGQVVMGLAGRAGALIDNVSIHCGTPGMVLTGNVTNIIIKSGGAQSGPAGSGTGGTPFMGDCPSGLPAGGVTGRVDTNAKIVRQLGLLCYSPEQAEHYPVKTITLNPALVSPGGSLFVKVTLAGPSGQFGTKVKFTYLRPADIEIRASSGAWMSADFVASVPGGGWYEIPRGGTDYELQLRVKSSAAPGALSVSAKSTGAPLSANLVVGNPPAAPAQFASPNKQAPTKMLSK